MEQQGVEHLEVAGEWLAEVSRGRVPLCARFLFFFAHLAPDEPHTLAQQLLAARPYVLKLYPLLELWAPEGEGLPLWLFPRSTGS